MKRFQAGDRLAIPAPDYNAMADTAEAFLRSRQNMGGLPGLPAYHPTIVAVTNNSETDWPIWRPVGVTRLDTDTTDALDGKGLVYSGAPYFAGYDLDQFTNDIGPPTLGITQEPIAASRTGRVCISGPTWALEHRPDGWTFSGRADWLFVTRIEQESEESEDPVVRWLLQKGPHGDARAVVLTAIPYDDGTQFSDQYLALVDLCDVPHRVHGFCQANQLTIPANTGVVQTTYYATTPNTLVSGVRSTLDMAASCGWDVEPGHWGWTYRIDEGFPVRLQIADESLAAETRWGFYTQDAEIWPHLPGLEKVCRGWYKAGETKQYIWVHRSPGTDVCFLKATARPTATATRDRTGAYPCNQDGSVVYDGAAHGGITYPYAPAAQVYFPNYYWNPASADPRIPNVQTNQIFRGTIIRATSPANCSFDGEAGVMDDPIGTIKIWNTNDPIPDGWQEVNALKAHFAVGYSSGDPNFGTFQGTGGNRTHTHTGSGMAGGSEGGSSAGTHLPPYYVIKFIERYR